MREAGLDSGAAPPEPELLSVPPIRHASSADVAITGLHRTREWDVTALAEAPELEGHEVRFDVLPDGTILVEDEVGDAGLAPLAEAVEASLPSPYRA
ncbi:MAG: hypothetical protein QOF50_111, partial [Gaiellaceae bacterium]|nr:hypothetical protein [Gaiellaceae bacterium]